MTGAGAWQRRSFAKTVGAGYAWAVRHEGFARLAGRLTFGADLAPMYAAMDAVAHVPAGAHVLDVPCGGGVTIPRLRPGQDVRYVAVDISAGMLDYARTRLRADLRDTVEFVEASIEAIPFADDTFDLAVCFNGLHCLPDPAAGVAEVARVLKPGGRLIGDFAARGLLRRADAYMALLRAGGAFGPAGTVDDARSWFSAAGLHIDALETSGAIAQFAVHK